MARGQRHPFLPLPSIAEQHSLLWEPQPAVDGIWLLRFHPLTTAFTALSAAGSEASSASVIGFTGARKR